jgi:hypothetical protein
MSRDDEATVVVGSQKPSLGRIVLYRSSHLDGYYTGSSVPPDDHPAIITGVNRNADGNYDGTVALHVFYPLGCADMLSVPEADEEHKQGRWRWPERT